MRALIIGILLISGLFAKPSVKPPLNEARFLILNIIESPFMFDVNEYFEFDSIEVSGDINGFDLYYVYSVDSQMPESQFKEAVEALYKSIQQHMHSRAMFPILKKNKIQLKLLLHVDTIEIYEEVIKMP